MHSVFMGVDEAPVIRPSAILFMLTALTIACGDHQSPTTTSTMPSPTPTPAPAPHSLVTRQLTGTVTDEQGAPVAGATVATSSQGLGSSQPVSTNANGFYEMPIAVDTSFPFAWISWTIRKEGFEETDNGEYVQTSHDATADFHLFKAASVPSGFSAQFLVAFDGPLCGLEGEYPCRHVSIRAASTGTLFVDVEPSDSSSNFAFGPVQYPFHGTAHQAIPVTGGQIVFVEVLRTGGSSPLPTLPGPQAFTLKTSLEP